jgi:hypothetical protein
VSDIAIRKKGSKKTNNNISAFTAGLKTDTKYPGKVL